MAGAEQKETRGSQLYQIVRFESLTHPLATICIVEDQFDIIHGFAPAFTNNGYTLIGFSINSNYHPTVLQQHGLADRVIETGVNLAIIDKGLGNVDGVSLVNRLKDARIATVMLTGEKQTRETHRVADRFLVKPIRPSFLVNEIDDMLGMKR